MPMSVDTRGLLVLATSCVTFSAVAAQSEPPPLWQPYVVVSAEADDADSSQAGVELGSSIGAAGWIRAGAGLAELADTEMQLDTTVFELRGGASIGAIDLAAGLAHRADGEGFKQQDWNVALGWQFGRGSIGADVFVRSADAETVTSVRRRRQNPREVRLIESIDGTGYGLHADFDLTPAATLFASWMKYNYDIATNRPLLARFSLLNGSGITRSEAFLDRSFEAGFAYHFRNVSLTTQYMRDESLVAEDISNSVQTSVLILIGDHWSVTPMAGISDNELRGRSAFGGLSVGYTW